MVFKPTATELHSGPNELSYQAMSQTKSHYKEMMEKSILQKEMMVKNGNSYSWVHDLWLCIAGTKLLRSDQ